MTDKQINKSLRRQFSLVGWVLVGYFALMTVLVNLTAVLDMAKQTLWNISIGDWLRELDMDAIANNAWGYIVAIITMLLIFLGWKGRDYWKRNLLVKKRPMHAADFLCVLSLCMGAQLLSNLWIMLLELVVNQFGISVIGMLESVSGSAESPSMLLYMCVFAPVFEEILFRGYVLRSLQPYGQRFSIICSAVLFSLFHGNLLQMPYAFMAGLLLGYVAAEYSLPWAMAVHVFNNAVLAEGLSLLTAGLPEMVAGTIHMALFGVSALVSVGILAAKRKQIARYRSEWIDRRCVKCLFTNSGILALLGIALVNIALFLNM